MGGFSGEAEISRKSARVIAEHLDEEQFNIYLVEVKPDHWWVEWQGRQLAVNRDDFSIKTPEGSIHLEAAFNAIHGKPGEDGPLAGYFELLGIPHTASGSFESALTFNKGECNIILQKRGYQCPPARFINTAVRGWEIEVLEQSHFPCFVKPSRSGSSIGVSKVKQATGLLAAVEKAKTIDHKVLIEEMITGTELACGVWNARGKVEALAVTDIVPQNDFFDYESKYSGLSEEVTPARISDQLYRQVILLSEAIYRELNLNGLARVDFIAQAETPYLIEVNTVPGFSAESILPKQAQRAGLSLTELFNLTLEKALNEKT